MTDIGREGLRSDEACICAGKQIEGGWLVCRDCGTIYGKLSAIHGGSARADYKALGR